MVSSANFRSLTEVSFDVQSFVYREKSSGVENRDGQYGLKFILRYTL